MATFKHISSKNADYGAAEQYLTFEHDEFTMKPTLDEAGRLILREDYRIATLNCGEEDFAVACMRANLRYGKNQKREDVKSHHYIISFEPRDAADNGLTVDRAQALGEEFCAEHFPGHQAIVCTHPDGHNHSGNIHVHIVINSLRIEEVPLLPYMDRPADTRAGCKHRCTDAAMEYFKAEVMEMCHRENLYQIDLLHGSKNRITEREYWAHKKGQAKLDKENAALAAEGKPVKQTKFETDKAKLRQTIRNAMSEATTFDEFSALLLQQGVTVKESRGRLSYLTPDRTKPITARKLGDDFDRAAVLTLLEQNAHRAAEKTVKEHLRLIKKQGKTILIAEHRLYYLTELADRIVYLEKGEIKGIYTPEEFRQLSEPDREHMGLRAVDLQAVFPPKTHLPAPTPVLELRNVTLRYKKQTILHDIGLSAGKGEVIGVVGHNGAGKTTFSRALCGLHKDCDGQFLWERKPIERKERLKRSYMVMQDVNYELFADSVEAECSFGIRNPDQTLVNATLEELGLTPYRERHPNTLSGGQKQRVAVAVSMICGKDLLVFDEPTSGLDFDSMTQVAGLIRRLSDMGKVIFIVTHDFEFVCRTCSRVLHFDEGEMPDDVSVTMEALPKLRELFSVSDGKER